MSGRIRLVSYEVVPATPAFPVPEIQEHLRGMAVGLARAEDAIALEALLTTEPGHRDSLHWILDQQIGWGRMEPRAIACAWGWEP